MIVILRFRWRAPPTASAFSTLGAFSEFRTTDLFAPNAEKAVYLSPGLPQKTEVQSLGEVFFESDEIENFLQSAQAVVEVELSI